LVKMKQKLLSGSQKTSRCLRGTANLQRGASLGMTRDAASD